MNYAQALEQELTQKFIKALRGLLDSHVGVSSRKLQENVDIKIRMKVAGKPFTLLVEVKNTVYPRDARQSIHQLKRCIKTLPGIADAGVVLPVLVAAIISPGAQEFLRSEQVGYYDSGGSLFLPVKGAYVDIVRPPPKALARATRSLFSNRRAQVLHALLVRPNDWFSVKRLSEESLVSPATASQVLQELERSEWAISRGQGPGKQRRLQEPKALLDAWAKQAQVAPPEATRRYFVPKTPVDHLPEQIEQLAVSQGLEYALAYEAAAQHYAPFLSGISRVHVRILATPKVKDAIASMGSRAVNEGANLVVIAAKSRGELLFREKVNGVWLASPIQVYLELLRGEGRAKEMAEHLRKERIGF